MIIIKKLTFCFLLVAIFFIFPTLSFAQTQTESNEVITRVGNPPLSSGGGLVSCPIPNGLIATRAYPNGHCSPGYSFACLAQCPTTSRRAKAIDIATRGGDVTLPTINGQAVTWKLLARDYPIDGGEGGGVGRIFEATVGSDKWYLDILHMQSSQLTVGGEYPSGTSVGKSVITHVHATIGKNIKNPTSQGSVATDCDPGWLNSEFMCDPTTSTAASAATSGEPTRCSGNPISFGAEKRFLPLPNEGRCSQTQTGACGRPGNCAVPRKIVLHVTVGGTDADSIHSFFAAGSLGNGVLRGVGAHFVVDKAGKVLQLVETLEGNVEVAYAVANYSDHISIEMVNDRVYNSKTEAPPSQYNATVALVRNLMRQYNIPLSSLEYTWQSPSDGPDRSVPPGVFGHYQLNPSTRTDPGAGFMRDLRADLK